MSVARAYAKALFEAAAEGKSQADLVKSCEEIDNQLKQFDAMIQSSKDAQVALISPVVTAKEKKVVVEALAAKMGLSTQVSRFLSLLALKERLGLLTEIRDVFSEVRLASEGGVSGRLVSAEPMSDSDVDSLATAFSRKLGKKVAFRVTTDASLLAGVRVTVNGVTYDGTLRSQLDQLRDKFVATAAAVQ